MTEESWSITALADEFGVTLRTIRHYEDVGLITPERRGTARVFHARDRIRLQLILRGKRLGFSLPQIRTIVNMYDEQPGEAGQLQYLLDQIDVRRAELDQMRRDIDETMGELAHVEQRCREDLAALTTVETHRLTDTVPRMTYPDEQGTLPVPGGRVWWRRIGDGPGIPLLLLHGGPGDELGGSRRVARRPAGHAPGRGLRPARQRSLRPAGRRVPVDGRPVRRGARRGQDGARPRTVNLLGHSWGTMLAASYLATDVQGVRSVVFSSPCLDARQWATDQQAHLAKLPADVREVIERCEREGTTASEDYAMAMAAYYRRHLVRLDPWPDDVAEMLQDINLDVYGRMWGSSEWNATGTLGDFDARGILPTIDVPTLFLAGEHDEALPETVRAHAGLVPDSTVHVFGGASHMSYIEVPEDYRRVVGGFLDERGL